MIIVTELRLRMIAVNILLLILCCVQPGEAQTVSLEEYLTMVRQNHPFFASESLSVNISVESQARHLGDKDWLVESSPFVSYEDRRGWWRGRGSEAFPGPSGPHSAPPEVFLSAARSKLNASYGRIKEMAIGSYPKGEGRSTKGQPGGHAIPRPPRRCM